MENNRKYASENNTLGFIGLLLAIATIVFGILNVIRP